MTMDWRAQREEMVTRQLERRGIRDRAVLDAMRRVPRHLFVPEEMREFAYEDRPLPIGDEQTISQPYVVALTVQALSLRAGGRVLDVGTGSGYAAAVLAELADEVYSIERIARLAQQARDRLAGAGNERVRVVRGDGTRGLPEHAPYAGIAVAAAAAEVPSALPEQLEVGARLVIPVGDQEHQELLRITRREESSFERESLGPVRYVPLIED